MKRKYTITGFCPDLSELCKHYIASDSVSIATQLDLDDADV